MMPTVDRNRIEQRIFQTITGDVQFMGSYRGKSDETATITRAMLQQFQIHRVNRVVEYARSQSPYYRESLADCSLLRTMEDLKKLPFLTHEELRKSPYQLLCVSLTGVARVFTHFTTGTLGWPKKIFFSEGDVERIVTSMADIIGNVVEGAGLKISGAKVAIYLPNNGRPLSMAEMIARGTRQLEGIPFIGSCNETTENQIDEIVSTRPEVLMGSAFRIWRITQVGRGSHNLRKVGVKAVFITSEYLSSAMRERLEREWGATVFHHYGMTEPGFAIGIECGNHDGFHYDESNLLFEVVDPVTGKQVRDGEEGELVFTSLEREAMPLIRYRTGDIASLTQTPCLCGSPLLSRIGVLHKKIGLIHELGTGEKIYSALFDEALYPVEDLIDYQIYLTRENGRDNLLCVAEMLADDGTFKERLEDQLKMMDPIKRAMKAGVLEPPVVELAPRESLRRGGMSMKRKIVDKRNGNPESEKVNDQNPVKEST